MSVVADVLAATAMLSGCGLLLVAAVGLFRLPDSASRLQAATKAQVLGLVLVVIGASLLIRQPTQAVELWLVALFQLATAPVLGQLLGRTAHADGDEDTDLLVVDERTPAAGVGGPGTPEHGRPDRQGTDGGTAS